MKTIKDIARESGYSVGTVSRALNNRPGVSKTAKQRILTVVERHNFQLNENAKFLKQRRSRGIALVLKGMQNMLFASLLEQLQQRIEAEQYECFIFYLNEDENEVELAKQICRERKPEGILFLGCNLELFREEFGSIDIPCVLLTNDGSGLGFQNLSSVSTDDEAAAEFAVNYLIENGHTRIGVIGGHRERSTPTRIRYAGCLKAFRTHGIRFDEAAQYETAYFSMEDGYYAMRRLLQKMPDITAVFVMADVMAIGAIRAAADRGLSVPEDLSVIGFDGLDITDYLNPRLTTIRQNRDLLMSRSIEILLAGIREGQPAVHEMEPFQLIAGNSVRNLAKGPDR